MTLCIARVVCVIFSLAAAARAATVLVEAESFAEPGGWSLDTQFIREMGSPYLLAHGLGTPVADATTKVQIPSAGTWHVWVRTKDWVPEPQWDRESSESLWTERCLPPCSV